LKKAGYGGVFPVVLEISKFVGEFNERYIVIFGNLKIRIE
jgi:hypothetical protein